MNPEVGPDGPDEWADIELLGMGFGETVEKLLKMPSNVMEVMDMETGSGSCS